MYWNLRCADFTAITLIVSVEPLVNHLTNLLAAISAAPFVCRRYYSALAWPLAEVPTVCEPAPLTEPAPETGPASAAKTPSVPTLTAGEQLKQQRREQRRANYEQVIELHSQGLSIKVIAEQLKMQRRTVRHFIRADGFPERAPPTPRSSKLDPFLPYLRQRWDAGCHNATLLWREITAQGFRGALTLVNRAVLVWRYEQPGYSRGGSPRTAASTLPVTVLSARQLSWWVLTLADTKDEDAREQQVRFTEHLCEACPEIRTAQTLANAFIRSGNSRSPPSTPGSFKRNAAG